MVRSPANTSHFLQACDDQVNRRFKKSVRGIRDLLMKNGRFLNSTSKQFKLICGSWAWERITSGDIRLAFENVGLWPMDMRFLKQFRPIRSEIIAEAIELRGKGGNSNFTRSAVRDTDQKIMEKIQDISAQKLEPSKAVQQVTLLLQKAETAHSIIFGNTLSPLSRACPRTILDAKRERPSKPLPGDQPSGGAPAEHLTHRERLRRLLWKGISEEAAAIAKKWLTRARERKANEKKGICVRRKGGS